MRINKAIKALFGAVIVSVALSSCSAASVEELLSPPRLDEEQTAIYEALRTAAGGSVSLKYPKSGQYRSAFVVENIDDEPTNEAIVFYEKPNVAEGASIRLQAFQSYTYRGRPPYRERLSSRYPCFRR